MGFLIGFLSVSFVISLIVVFHEFGHYITAKKSGILVREFSIGFGPLLFGKQYGETLYCVRPIPLGGYVDLAGMDENDELEDSSRAFYNKSPWAKMLILFAGSFMNFVLAFLIYWIINSGYGLIQKPYYTIPVVSLSMADSPAYEVGIRKADVILEVDAQKVASWDQFRNYVQQKPGVDIKVKIDRAGAIMDFTVKPKANPKTGKGYIGLMGDSIAEIGEVIPESPAFKAKFKPGDRMLKVAGRDVKYYSQIEDALKESDGKTISFVLMRGTTEMTIESKVDFGEHFGFLPPVMPIIGDVMDGMPAAVAGIKPKDKIVKINGTEVYTWAEMLGFVSQNPGKELAFTVSRGEKEELVDLKVTPRLDKVSGEGRIGVAMKSTVGEKLGILEGARQSFNQVVMITIEMLRGIKKLVLGAITMDYVQGPVGIAKTVKDQAVEGFFSLLNITALISINIGLLNLFPIPGLDGGRIIFTFIETIRRRRLSTAIEEKIHAFGIVLLILLAILVTYKDIMRLIWS